MESQAGATTVEPGECLAVRREGAIGFVAFDNPDRGFLTPAMLRALDRTTGAWERDPTLRVVVLTGAQPGTFITHFDPDELKTMSDTVRACRSEAEVERTRRNARRAMRLLQWVSRRPRLYRFLERRLADGPLAGLCGIISTQRMLQRWQRSSTIYIAAINGCAMGGGLELALACDFRYMARGDHVLGLPECIAGITTGMGGSQRLARLVGPQRAAAMLLRGDLLDADAAERLGIVDSAVEAEKLQERVSDLARCLAAQPPLAQRGVKRAIHEGQAMSMELAAGLEADQFLTALLSRDATALAEDFLQRLGSGERSVDIFRDYGGGHPSIALKGQ